MTRGGYLEEAARSPQDMTAQESTAHTEHCRSKLLSLANNQDAWINGIHVKRVPCAGVFFDVPVTVSDVGLGHTTYQMLPFSGALERVRSGYVKVVRQVHRPTKAECGVCKQTVRLQNSSRSLDWCTPCQMEMCSSCHSECHERHESDPNYRREFNSEQLEDLAEARAAVFGVVRDAAAAVVHFSARGQPAKRRNRAPGGKP